MAFTSPGTDSESARPRFAQWWLACVCFFAGAAVMVIEITAYRLLAPIYGNSAFTWTAVIGVILVSFSAGSFVGGWLAERKPEFALLGWLLTGAAVLAMLVPLVFSVMSPVLGDMGLISGPLVIALVLFLVPGMLLGAVSPASVRLFSLLSRDAHVGFAAGMISMLGSLGSFAGTLLSGFYLLSNFGVKSIFIGTGVVLMLTASVAFALARNPKHTHLPAWLAALAAGMFGFGTQEAVTPGVLYQQESFYHRIEVIQHEEKGGTMRYLHLDSVRNGGIRIDDGGIAVPYQEFWRLPLVKPGFELKRAFFIGAGAFGMPEQVSRRFPEAEVDVSEIDPDVIKVGRQYFNLDAFPKVHALTGDARRLLRIDEKARYDLIFGDAYSGKQIPSHVATKEFFQLVRDRLSDHGVYVMNVITAVEGPRAELLAGMAATLGEVFPHVEIFALKADQTERQNVILMATNESWRDLFVHPEGRESDLVQHYLPREQRPAGGVVFTDDLNPMDGILARSLWLGRKTGWR